MKRWIAIAACLSINAVSVGHVLAQRRGGPGYLGVGVADVTSDAVKQLGLKIDHGVVVMNVQQDTPAAKAGLKERDVIVVFDGRPIADVDRFMRIVRETLPGHKVTITVNRDGSFRKLNATLEARFRQYEEGRIEPPEPPEPPMPVMPQTPWDEHSPAPLVIIPPMPQPVFSWRQTTIGIEAEGLRGQLADFFGVKEGVLVRSVDHNTPAERAGLKAGDVIVRVGETPVRSPQGLSSEVASLTNSKSPVTLAVIRNHKEASFGLRIVWDDGR